MNPSNYIAPDKIVSKIDLAQALLMGYKLKTIAKEGGLKILSACCANPKDGSSAIPVELSTAELHEFIEILKFDGIVPYGINNYEYIYVFKPRHFLDRMLNLAEWPTEDVKEHSPIF